VIALSHKRSEAENPPARASLKLRLYLSDHTFETVAAVAQVHSFLQKHGSTYALEILDVHENQDLVRQDEVPFTPMLLRLEPAPVLRIGMPAKNLSELETALLGNFGPMVDSTPVTERHVA
jgi:hypothetical protein